MDFDTVKTEILDRLQTDLPRNLHYHSVRHTLDVLNAVTILTESEKVTEHNHLLLQTAALFHDAGFLIQYYDNETQGCKLAETVLPEYGYNSNDIKFIQNIIMATRIPQSPKNHIEQIMCDADLDYLGRKDFHIIAKKLRQELKEHDKDFSDEEWIQFEVNFLEKHQYFTETARKLRNTQKIKYLNELKAQL